jgi:DNA-binding transcriptional ArsR family regulator
MGLLTDILKEIPQAAVLKEKIAAIEAKYAAADTENAILKDDLRKANTEIVKLRKQVEDLTPKDDLDEIEMQLLQRIVKYGPDNQYVGVFTQDMGLQRQRIEYHLQRLLETGYVESGLYDPDFGEHYELTQKARSLLIRNGLL